MAKANLTFMRWLRENVKQIIWATVSLFVLSVFIIGLGSRRAARNQKQRSKNIAEAERRAAEAKNAVPRELRDVINLPVAHISYPTKTASLTTSISLKDVFMAVKNSSEYKQLSQMPDSIKSFYSKMLKERAVGQLITLSLIELYAQANNIKPPVTPEMIVARDMKQIGPREFNRKLRREGIDAKEYGLQRLKQVISQAAIQSALKPIPVASATDEVVKKYYEDHKIRFKKDDEITFKNLLISPDDFLGKASVSDEMIKKYYDEHRTDFMSSERLLVRHIYINPTEKSYMDSIPVSEKEINQKYSDELNKFKTPEKVKASHILIKPKNNFDYKFPNFKVSLDSFKSGKVDEKNLYRFHMGLSNLKSSANVGFDSLSIITEDGQSFYPTEESLKNVDKAISLPLTGSTKPSVFGEIGIFVDSDSAPKTLEIKDGAVSYQFDISAAFDEKKAFAAAKLEIDKLLKRAKAGEDFAKLAKEYSQDIGSAEKGGELGEFARGAMVKPFEDAAFKAKNGEIVGPVKTRFGYHIIKVEKRIPEKFKSLDEVRTKLLADIRKEKAAAKAESVLQTAKQKVEYRTASFESMVKLYSMGKSRKDGGLLPILFSGAISEDYSPEQRKLLKEEIGSPDGLTIDPAIEKPLFNLVASATTDVIKTSNGYHLFVLENKYPKIQLSLTKSLKDKIRKIVEKQELEKLAKNKADELASKYLGENAGVGIEKLAKAYKADIDVTDVTFGPLPFSKSPGFSSLALSKGVGKYTSDGRTYVSGIHKAIMALLKSGDWKNKIVGPVKSDLGYHFISIDKYESDRYEPFEKIKDKIKRMITLEPTEKAIQELFKKNIDKYDVPAKRKVREIVVDNEVLANKLYKRLQNGEIFSLLAKTYSIDSSATMGGKIPDVKKGQLSDNLEKAVWSLKKGEFCKPIKTSYGYVIFTLEADEIPGRAATLSNQVRNDLRKQLRQKYQEEAISAFIKGLQNKAYVVRHPDVLSKL